ncbi:MAG: (4Fe-4S)-binding protein [Armatimonadetes bacterium]|nr:(4Fe-4S)-binding protein [Armatimonadota bacterium]
MRVCVASGKGGTGKTLVSTSLALTLGRAEPVQLLDCDAEAPNAHLFLKPIIRQRKAVTTPVPTVDARACTHCGECARACRFNAIASLPETTVVFADLCHACGVCISACPARALSEFDREIGYVEIGEADGIAYVGGTVNVGEPRSGAVIAAVKSYAGRGKTVILDAPPGTSCPVVETLRGCDLALLVTEPTPFGLNDLRLAVETVRAMGIEAAVVINRDGIGDDRVGAYCRAESIPIWARIPHDRRIAEIVARGERAHEAVPELRTAMDRIADRLSSVAAPAEEHSAGALPASGART